MNQQESDIENKAESVSCVCSSHTIEWYGDVNSLLQTGVGAKQLSSTLLGVQWCTPPGLNV